MRNLFAAFYDHIRDGAPPPIESAEMVRVTEVMDAVFAAARAAESRPPQRVGRRCEATAPNATPSLTPHSAREVVR